MSVGPALIGYIVGPLLGIAVIAFLVSHSAGKSKERSRLARGLPKTLPKTSGADSMNKALRREFDRRVANESLTLFRQDKVGIRGQQHGVWLSHHISPGGRLGHILLFTQGHRYEIRRAASVPGNEKGATGAGPATAPARPVKQPDLESGQCPDALTPPAGGWTPVATVHDNTYEYRMTLGTVEEERRRRATCRSDSVPKPCEFIIYLIGWTAKTPGEVDGAFRTVAGTFDRHHHAVKAWPKFIGELAGEVVGQEAIAYKFAVSSQTTCYRQRATESDITYAAGVAMWTLQMQDMEKEALEREKLERLQDNIALAESFKGVIEGAYELAGIAIGHEVAAGYSFDGSGGGGGGSGGGGDGGGGGSCGG